MAGLGNLLAEMSAFFGWTAQNDIVGEDYQPVKNSSNIAPSMSYSTAIPNTQEGGADEVVSFILNVAISSSATIDLESLTNIVQQTGVDLARVKAYMFRLLSPADDPVYGTLCSSIAWGNNGTAPNQLNLTGGSTANINNGGTMLYFDESATGFTVGAIIVGGHIVKFVNNDSTAGGTGPTSHTAAIQISIIGASS